MERKHPSVYVCIYFTPTCSKNYSKWLTKKKKRYVCHRAYENINKIKNFEREVDSNMLTMRVNENKNESFHYTDGGLLMWFGWQVC